MHYASHIYDSCYFKIPAWCSSFNFFIRKIPEKTGNFKFGTFYIYIYYHAQEFYLCTRCCFFPTRALQMRLFVGGYGVESRCVMEGLTIITRMSQYCGYCFKRICWVQLSFLSVSYQIGTEGMICSDPSALIYSNATDERGCVSVLTVLIHEPYG